MGKFLFVTMKIEILSCPKNCSSLKKGMCW